MPLTRIRDIAHRNDIPSDLKREIKHTLQNKLHRNAGPEDLVATEAMLGRITAHGTNYSEAFVHEFRVFTDELRDFFNAGSLVQILDGVRPALDESGQAALNHFLQAKGHMEHDGSAGAIADCLHQLTSVRITELSCMCGCNVHARAQRSLRRCPICMSTSAQKILSGYGAVVVDVCCLVDK